MARTIAQWQAIIVAAKDADPVIGTGGTNELSSTSNVAIWLLWTWVVATAMWTLDNLMDALVALVNSIIATQKPHTRQWYATIAKAFQYGDTLPPDKDVYNPVAPAGDPKYVVNFAAAVELVGEVRIKVATLSGGVLAPLSGPQMAAFTPYMLLVKDAGVRLQLTTGLPDNLQLSLNIYYDPLVLNALGQRIDGTNNTPVQDAVNAFLDSLPFNGVFIYNKLVDAIQAVEGVVIGEPLVCQANYGITPYVDIIDATPSQYVPDAGYLTLDEVYFLANVTYTAYSI